MRLLTNLSPQTNRSHLALVAVVALLSQTPATADAVVAGSLVLSYDQTGFGRWS